MKISFPDNVYILIDPGHGGAATPVGSENKDYNIPSRSATQDLDRIVEQEYVTEIAQGVRTLLNSAGFNNVELTRDTNIYQKNQFREETTRF
jgi:N-acetylmuramoyl-L-alanine amidase